MMPLGESEHGLVHNVFLRVSRKMPDGCFHENSRDFFEAGAEKQG